MEPFDIPGPAGRLRGWTAGARDADRLPVLFVHPINLQGASWEGVAAALDPPRFALMPDMRAHGGSDAAGPFGLEEWGSDLLAVLDHFEVPRAHVVGGSLGGPLAIWLAATHPERVASITAIGSALAIEGDDVEAVLDVLREKGVQGMFREVIPVISVAPGTDTAVIERILELANPNDVETVGAVWGATIAADSAPLAPRVTVPALVISGEHDKTCTPDQGREMATALETELVMMPGVGHLPMVEAPAALAALVSPHLDSA
jgi:pimeloyl-ACP methyl ester carboxylesterase